MSIILKAENISKQYRLGTVGTGTLSHDLNRWWHQIRGEEDPYLNVGAVNDRGSKAKEDYVWALRDINFEVKQGEVLGIIGKNGAGKSTLLKILSRVTAPTTGSIRTKGRIASLLEVGTGFHPELTGRENIYLNGAILGMTKPEIRSKIDEIIAFSGCEKYIDTPVKRYSSGMRVRLGFAVAAHLEPEILVVDEVLAVGDAEFQKKAIGKMQDLSTGEGRTVLFVSHNMVSVEQLCTRGILLEDGLLIGDGEIQEVIDKYLQLGEQAFTFRRDRPVGKMLYLEDVYLLNQKKERVSKIQSGKDFHLILEVYLEIDPINLVIELGIDDSRGDRLAYLSNIIIDKKIRSVRGKNYIEIIIKKFALVPAEYKVTVRLSTIGLGELDRVPHCFDFKVEEGDFYGSGKLSARSGKFLLTYDFFKQ